MMLKELNKINDSMLELNKNDANYQRRHMIIKKILSDENCFFKMNIEYAYAILKELNIKENELKDVYCKLRRI